MYEFWRQIFFEIMASKSCNSVSKTYMRSGTRILHQNCPQTIISPQFGDLFWGRSPETVGNNGVRAILMRNSDS